MDNQAQVDFQIADRTTLVFSRDIRLDIRTAVFHRINAERSKLKMLENIAHEVFPIGDDDDRKFSSQAVGNLLKLMGMGM